MTWLKRTAIVGLSVVGVVFVHLATNAVLPAPWNQVNMVFVFLIFFLLFEESGTVVWIAFSVHFFIELYAVSPFGILLFSGTISTLLSFWLYQYFFTNQSWYTAAALSLLAIVIYRSIYTALFLFFHVFGYFALPPWSALLLVYGWEMLLTSGVTGLAYLLTTRPFHKKRKLLPVEWRV